MRKFVLFAFLLILLFAIATSALYVRQELQTRYPQRGTPGIVEIPRGLKARDVVGLLADRNVIHNRYVALTYLFYKGLRHKLQAGEYLFDRPMTPDEVLTRIASGAVYLHKFLVPEGLTVNETAQKWEEQGFGPADDFKRAAHDSAE